MKELFPWRVQGVKVAVKELPVQRIHVNRELLVEIKQVWLLFGINMVIFTEENIYRCGIQIMTTLFAS